MDIGNQLLESLGMALDEPAVYVFKAAASVPKGDIIGYYSVYREEDILKLQLWQTTDEAGWPAL